MKDLFELFNRKNIFVIYGCKTVLGYTSRINRFDKGVSFSKLEDYMKEHKNNSIMFIFDDDTTEIYF